MFLDTSRSLLRTPVCVPQLWTDAIPCTPRSEARGYHSNCRRTVEQMLALWTSNSASLAFGTGLTWSSTKRKPFSSENTSAHWGSTATVMECVANRSEQILLSLGRYHTDDGRIHCNRVLGQTINSNVWLPS